MDFESLKRAMEQFKSGILRIRDLLRAEAITGMDSMRTICLYILSRHITRDRISVLRIPDKFAWENIYENLQLKEGGLQMAMDLFYHPRAECLVFYFDRLFGTKRFNFDLKSLQRHKEILEILHPMDLQAVDHQMDILGWVYEQHLGSGASSASRDMGQFFTDRSVCNYMTRLCRPGFKFSGVPESVCDPTMGTAGFLTTVMKYYRETYPDVKIDWSVQQKEIHGVEKDMKVAGLARLNMFIESDCHIFENLKNMDSLNEDLPQTGYDVILANMPFGIKGLKHADCCDRVKNLKIRGTKSEPLFLQLMMISLNRSGRCAVIVPDGVLTNLSDIHVGTRKYLLDHYELKKVIKMKDGFFMNTGIQPSILFFENTGNPTREIEFLEIKKEKTGEITEDHITTLNTIDLDQNKTFDCKRHIHKITTDRTNLHVYKTLGEILTDHSVKTPISVTGKTENGVFGLYSSSKETFKCDSKEFEGEFIIQGSRGTITEATHYASGSFSCSNNVFVFSSANPNDVSLKYVYHYLVVTRIVETYIKTSVIPMLTKTVFKEIRIPIPPRPVQDQIVEALDIIYTDKESASKMIHSLRSQMKSIVRSQQGKYPTVKLGSLYSMPVVKNFTSNDRDNHGQIPFYNGQWNSPVGAHSAASYESDQPYFVMIKDGGGDHTSYQLGLGMFFKVQGKCAVTSQNKILTPITYDPVTHSYVYYYMHAFIKEFRDTAKYSINLAHISITSIMDFPVILPPLQVQQDIVRRLDAIDAQINSLQALIDSSEANATFILNSYLQTGN